jgi:hypothetical protein
LRAAIFSSRTLATGPNDITWNSFRIIILCNHRKWYSLMIQGPLSRTVYGNVACKLSKCHLLLGFEWLTFSTNCNIMHMVLLTDVILNNSCSYGYWRQWPVCIVAFWWGAVVMELCSKATESEPKCRQQLRD